MDDEPDVDALRRARPAQDDPIAAGIQARVRAALTGGEAPTTRIDRFTVLEVVGSGGMGVVYAAYDPKLDRRVAIKVLHVADERTRDRVLAEARSLARLSHPNVVTVYDASDAGDDLFIAMEYVDGENLRRHLAAGPRSPSEVLAIFTDVGRGLAAAHAAGLIHGDIKPENILVGAGVAKVVDFGLARTETSTERLAAGTPGTPAYMAPAQLAGAPADPASDQFAFAAALYEALAGHRPFRGSTVDDQRRAIETQPPRPIAGVPVPVSRALARALRADAGARFPSMPALLAALAPPPRRWRTAVVAGVLPVVTVVAAIAIGGDADAPQACTTSAARLAAAWPAGFDRLDARTAATLRDYGAGWARMADDVCISTRRGEQSAAMLDLRMSCLDRRLDELGALAGTLAAATAPSPQALARGREAAHALSPLETCADRAQLAGVPPPAPAVAATVLALRRRLDQARGRQKTEAAPAARTDVVGVVGAARTLGYAPLLGEALLAEGQLDTHQGELDAAEAALAEAARVAAEVHDDLTLARAWSTRVFVANQRGHYREALAYGEAGEAAATRLRSPATLVAPMRSYVADAQLGLGQLEAARATDEDAVRVLEAARGPDFPLLGELLDSLADVAMRQGDLAAARRSAERSRAILEAAYGPEHQDVAVTLNTIAAITQKEGDLAGAVELLREVVRRDRAYAGEDHAYTAVARGNLGDALRRLGRYEEAEAELTAACAIWERTTGFDGATAIDALASQARLAIDRGDLPLATHRLEDVLARRVKLHGEIQADVADTLNDLGNVAKDAGELDRAVELYTRALRTYEQALGPDHPRVPIALSNLGEAAIAGRRYDQAIEACQRALELDTRALGATHPDLAYDLTCLGEAELGKRHGAAARTVLEQALALRERTAVAPAELARTRFALARALGPDAGARARALATAARDALDALAAGGGATTGTGTRAAIARWLAAH